MNGQKMWAVLEAIGRERQLQDIKWGEQNHAPADYLAILSEEVGEVAKEVVEANSAKTPKAKKDRLRNYRTELIQTAAVAVAMVECIDRQMGGVGYDCTPTPPQQES